MPDSERHVHPGTNASQLLLSPQTVQ
ncbi:hypothetical protein VTJ04DRAFT_7812 [Mycothermus thermophilus]